MASFLYVCTTVYTYTILLCICGRTSTTMLPHIDNMRHGVPWWSAISTSFIFTTAVKPASFQPPLLFYFIFFFPLWKQGNFWSLSFVSSAAGWSSSSSLVFVQQQQHKSAGNEERANGWTLSIRFLFEYVMVERRERRGGGWVVVGACFFTWEVSVSEGVMRR